VLLGGKRGWRTDDFSVAFLRSSVSASLENERKIPPAVSRCIDSRLRGMADVEFKRLALGLIGKRREANVRLLEMLSDCERRRRRHLASARAGEDRQEDPPEGRRRQGLDRLHAGQGAYHPARPAGS